MVMISRLDPPNLVEPEIEGMDTQSQDAQSKDNKPPTETKPPKDTGTPTDTKSLLSESKEVSPSMELNPDPDRNLKQATGVKQAIGSKTAGSSTTSGSTTTGSIELDLPQTDHFGEIDIQWLIEHHHVAVYRYAFRLTGNVNDAEDLTQQTFLMAHQRLSQLRDPQKCLSWMLTIVRNSFLKMNRRQRPSCAANLDLDVDQIQQPQIDELVIDSERLQMAFDQLESAQRMILIMFYFEQLSYRQIAEKLNVKIGTVMSRLSRAKSRLRGCLIAMDPDEDEKNWTKP